MMKNKLLRFALFAMAALGIPFTVVANDEGKILMIVSSNGKEAGEVAPGYEFDEFAKAYLVFKQNGLKVDIASPAGGTPVADKYNPEKDFNAEVLANRHIMAQLTQTIPTSAVNAQDYDAVFVVGGKGAMFDLPDDKALQQIIAEVWHQNGVVAAVCHGPAALVNVTLDDGSYLIANKKINGFTNQEEQLFGKKWINEFKFLLEDKFAERGAKFESSPFMLSHVAIDQRLITGQNPASTVAVANKVVEQLGKTPVQSAPYSDDYTLAIVADYLSGKEEALDKFKQQPENVQLEWVGMYGYYYAEVATTDNQSKQALELMQVAQPSLKHPMLGVKIAQVQHELGEVNAAIVTLNTLLKDTPDFQPALDMLKSLSI
ncbi:type 1 glutamine amidotransferase domain-containing protein [Alteromonas ponticola]|uniref:Type 1 glutamine amidotransferase domain-containing protein n=1 Tax=Alteromonas aquimaris TaxID=2998417 RepID=A0ABT3P8B1_9ALTE|nr:type 1 glutamine amidotransferase domain-containing protein [Alteromonas aquimaris]MCW8109014.1 type 1 glutamine amidotransferase domain-containing protein [Alteromonas aquimaris]